MVLGESLALKFRDNFKVFLASRNNSENQKIVNYKYRIYTCGCLKHISVRDAIIFAKPDIIIHAAATKFVDLSEKFPFECIDTNIIGSSNIHRVAFRE